GCTGAWRADASSSSPTARSRSTRSRPPSRRSSSRAAARASRAPAPDSGGVALTCADLGVRADELELPVPLDRASYRAAVARLEARGIIEQGRLSAYGKSVEAMPVDRPWAELLGHCDGALLP